MSPLKVDNYLKINCEAAVDIQEPFEIKTYD